MRNKIILLLILFSCKTVLPIVYGSTTVVSRQALVTLPANDATNELRGFGAFESGFTLTNASTSCLFTSLFPVSGPISLNGGTLNLSQSLLLDSDADIRSAGIINGNNYQLVLPAKVDALNLPSTTYTWNLTLNGVKLYLQSDLALKVPVIFQGACEIHGNGYALSLDNASGISIASGASLLMSDVVIKNISGNKIEFAATSSKLSLQDVTWWLTANTDITTGYFNVLGNWFIRGGYTLGYKTAQTSTILGNAKIQLGYGSTLSYSPSSSAKNLISFVDATAKLVLDSAILSASSVGLVLTKGTLIVDGKSYITSFGSNAATGILLGDGNSANDLTIEIMPGANVQVDGYVGYQNVN